MDNNIEMLLKVIIKKVNELDNKVESYDELIYLMRQNSRLIYIPFDPTEYIQQPITNFTKAYKYRGNLYIRLADLYDAINNHLAIKVEKSTFTKHYGKKTSVDWRIFEVNIVYLAAIHMNNGRLYYISTDGIFYTSNLEEVAAYGEYKNAVRLMDEGEYGLYYAGEYVMFKFINPDYPGSKVFFLDGDFSNCRIDNIADLKSSA